MVGGGPAGLQAAATAAQRGHHVTLLRAPAAHRRAGRRRRLGAVPRRVPRRSAQPGGRVSALRRGDQHGRGRHGRSRLLAESPDAVVLATGARSAAAVLGRRACRASWTFATCSKAAPSPPGRWSWSTTSASTRPPASPNCWLTGAAQVEIITAGMVVGQDLGITLDMETFNVRAHAKGIRQATDLVVVGGGRRRVGQGKCGSGGVVAHAAAPPHRRVRAAAVRLGGVRGPSGAARTNCGRSCRTRRSRCIASATASRRAGRTRP